MAGYNAWANAQFAQYFESVPEKLLTQFVPGSFPSIQKTLIHTWDAQDIWYRRLHGENPVKFRSTSWKGTTEDVLRGLSDSSDAYVQLIDSLDHMSLEEDLPYVTISSGPQTSRRYEILLHVFNHSMYHRGQCITMGHAVELKDMPSTDLIRYLRI